MPLYCYVGHDGADGAARRPEARPRHVDHLARLDVRFAGPLLDDEGRPRGSLIVFEAAGFDEARRIAHADPYLALGVFDRIDVYVTQQVLPAPA